MLLVVTVDQDLLGNMLVIVFQLVKEVLLEVMVALLVLMVLMVEVKVVLPQVGLLENI